MDGFTFTVEPPKAVTEYLANKNLRPSFSWLDVWGEEHAFAFTVAKATELNLLNDIFEALQKSIDQGTSFESFKRDIIPTLKTKGWWGEDLVDELDPDGRPTGRRVKGRLGSPRRLRTIYWANVRTARAAGQWQRIQQTVSILPFLSYELGPSEVHRPLHEDKQGTILPASDPFWTEWFAPNGWGCQCWHRQVSGVEARRRGISKSPNIRRITHKNKRTGEITTAPEGIDPGWNTNPGLSRERNARSFLAGALERAPQALAQVAIKDLLGDSEFKAHMRGERLTAWPIAVMDKKTADAVGSQTRTIHFSRESARTHNDQIKNKDYPSPEEFAFIQDNIKSAELKRMKAPKGAMPRFGFTFKAENGETYWGVFKVVRGAEIFLMSYLSKGRNKKGHILKGEVLERGGE